MAVVTMTEYGALPAAQICAADGAEITLSLFGAHLLSWKTADGQQRLFVSSQTPLDGSKAIRGGVPVIFPQFNMRGPGLRHGFARVSHWRVGASGEENGQAFIELELNQQDLPAEHAAAWPHDFALTLRYTLQGDALAVRFTVHNCGTREFPFGVALHTYFDVGQLAATSVAGLQGQRYTDHHLQTATQDQPALHFTEKQDRLYQSTPALTLNTASATLQLEQQGFDNWVVWNPGQADAAALTDLADEEYLRFICIEPARIDQQPLAAGASWTGSHRIRCCG
ncbi:D-hexose-6-phosphate mutarotase [Duganella qianjiadongensis]|uniref:Putative glucose-6-phosphate 1-epimerase n=1 Tax=Duganella qianjiadongensis TaxID=2692176 RepID=A0ABW9VGY5_9BURK|nr:D-hexose-6-phosphate mutarotase [Duganella qianjiadongensis]MYM38771.1 D-hexose-6-phosphate mutarotase [Duganella qianjiadongensis]